MTRLSLQHCCEIGERGAHLTLGIIGDGAGGARLGEIGRVIDGRGQMLKRDDGISGLQRLGAAPDQQVDAGGTRFPRFGENLGLDTQSRALIGILQPVIKVIQLCRILGKAGGGAQGGHGDGHQQETTPGSHEGKADRDRSEGHVYATSIKRQNALWRLI